MRKRDEGRYDPGRYLIKRKILRNLVRKGRFGGSLLVTICVSSTAQISSIEEKQFLVH